MTVIPLQRPVGSAERAVPSRLGSTIAAVASYVPTSVITNSDLEAMVDTSDTWILERTGIRERHRAGSGETAAGMGAVAAARALAMLGNPPVDAIICATCSPDTTVPSTACLIQRSLGLAEVPAFDVNAACSGYVYAVTIADSLIRTGTATTVLVVASEAMTSLVDYADRSTCVLFGDGAAATVLCASGTGGIRATRWGADGSHAGLIYYGPAHDASIDPATGETSSPDRIRLAGKGTFRLAVERMCEVTESLCADAAWELGEVSYFVPHQANLRIIEAAAKRLSVPREKVIINVDRLGNTSAASIPLALADAVAENRFRPGDRIISAAFGAGVTWGGLALEWNPTPAR